MTNRRRAEIFREAALRAADANVIRKEVEFPLAEHRPAKAFVRAPKSSALINLKYGYAAAALAWDPPRFQVKAVDPELTPLESASAWIDMWVEGTWSEKDIVHFR